MGSHLWPFTDVLREIWPGVTRKKRGLRDFAVEAAVSAAERSGGGPQLQILVYLRMSSLRDTSACRARRYIYRLWRTCGY